VPRQSRSPPSKKPKPPRWQDLIQFGVDLAIWINATPEIEDDEHTLVSGYLGLIEDLASELETLYEKYPTTAKEKNDGDPTSGE
jgi:hypothetical protein